VIEAKRKGKQVHAAAEVEEGETPPDLMTALRESIEHSTKRRSTTKRGRARRAA